MMGKTDINRQENEFLSYYPVDMFRLLYNKSFFSNILIYLT